MLYVMARWTINTYICMYMYMDCFWVRVYLDDDDGGGGVLILRELLLVDEMII